MRKSATEEIFDEVVKRNSVLNDKSVPDSSEFIRYLAATVAVPEQQIRQILRILTASHMIFTFEIVAEDPLRNVPNIEGYVAADLAIIRGLKTHFHRELSDLYNQQFHKNLMPHQIIKEIFPVIKSINNTVLGQTANKAIMLEEFEKLLERDYSEFTAEWKKQHLELELSRANLDHGKAAKAVDEAPLEEFTLDDEHPISSRAVDGGKYRDFISKTKNYPLQRILNIYGIHFFIRVHLRKYQFDYLKKLVEDGQISRRADLTLLKRMLHSMKANRERDPELRRHIHGMNELETTINHFIYFSEPGRARGVMRSP
ncbi:MAG TPA: hypothetical protein PL088_16195 [Spirochaetota bacterium]|nr:hypothetical protein [Spirochaetota bacterium]